MPCERRNKKNSYVLDLPLSRKDVEQFTSLNFKASLVNSNIRNTKYFAITMSLHTHTVLHKTVLLENDFTYISYV